MKKSTQTRPFKPTAVSNESFFPRDSRTGHEGELRSLDERIKSTMRMNDQKNDLKKEEKLRKAI